MLTPTPKATKCVETLMAEIYDFDDFVRSTGEQLATYDNLCRQALNGRNGTAQAVADLIAVAGPHMLALEMAGMSDQVMLTSVMLLITADMAKVPGTELGEAWLELHRQLLVTAIAALGRSGEDAFRREHLRAVVAIESRLFVHALELVGTYSAALKGIAEAARRQPEPEHLQVNPDAPAEALIDMFGRLRAIA